MPPPATSRPSSRTSCPDSVAEEEPLASEEPSMTIVAIHRLRATYAGGRKIEELEAAARADNELFPERVRALLPSPDEHLPTDIGQTELSPLDVKLRRICELYQTSGLAQRTFVLASIGRSIGSKLMGFGYRMATLAARQRSVDLVRLGLVALAVDDLASGDVRDVLRILAVLADAARRAGA